MLLVFGGLWLGGAIRDYCFLQSWDDLLFEEVAEDTLKRDDQDRAVHIVHSSGEQDSLRPFVRLRGRWQHLQAGSRTTLPNCAAIESLVHSFARADGNLGAGRRRRIQNLNLL